MRLAVDVGGTFTDLVLEDHHGGLSVYKTPTTPDDPVRGVLDVIELAARGNGISADDLLGEAKQFVHGTTRAINAILTGNAATTAFLTTEGHPDILLFREGGRSEAFDFTLPYPEPYVPRSLTFEVPERVTAAGEIRKALDETAVMRIAGQLQARQVEAVAVCLLWAVVNPTHELRVGELLDQCLEGVPYTLSHQLNPSVREYRRASSTAIDASLKPLMADYLRDLRIRLMAAGFRGRLLMVSSPGGVLDPETVAETPIQAIGSGPAMTPVAGRHYAALEVDARNVIVADTGGTSYDVSLVRDGRIPSTRETWLGPMYSGHMTGFPSVDVKSIGAGGGSIAWVDPGGLVHVGPESAGAFPGPACYARGGSQPTVTDAALVLGYVNAENFLGGSMKLDVEAAWEAIEREIASKLELDVRQAAAAVLQLVTEHMVNAIEGVTLSQGIDPRTAVLVAGGGAAGLNSVALAGRLRCRRVLIPAVGAALSAAGALMSDLRSDFAATLFMTTNRFDFDRVNQVLAELASKCEFFQEGPGAGSVESAVEYSAEARYPHQIWELELPLRSSRFETEAQVERLRQDFHQQHREIFAIDDPDSPVEIVGWRARVRCRLAETQRSAEPDLHDPGRSHRHGRTHRKVFFPGIGETQAQVELFEMMKPGELLEGPAVVESPVTTVVIDPGASAQRTAAGNLLINHVDKVAAMSRVVEARVPRPDGERLELDGVQLAVIANRLRGVVRKMMNTMLRTGRSGLINTARDFSCCVVTSENELLEVGASLPIHVMVGPELMAETMKQLHPRLQRGDAFLHNSPYQGNSHAADHVILVPVVDGDGVHRFTVMVKAHLADCGNSIPTTYHVSARDIYEEGALIFPMVRVQEDYKNRDDIIRMCEMRIRVPELWYGDYLAMVGSARIGERGILELGDEVGWDVLDAYVRAWFDYSEERMVESLSKLPAGKVTSHSHHDPTPGAPTGVPINVTVEVRPQQALVEVDLRDNIDCQPVGLNLSEATAHSAALIGVFNSIEPVVPTNAGSYRRIKVHLRENCVVGIPRHPYSCSAATSNLADRVSNVVQRAMAELGDGIGMAECGRIMPPAWAMVSGTDPRQDGARFINQLYLAVTGGGASPWADGWLTLTNVGGAGRMLRDSVEIDEIRHPMIVQAQHIIPDSEGAGRFRGAPGAYVEYGPLYGAMEALWHSDGNITPAQGARAGLPGGRSDQFLHDLDGQLKRLGAYDRVVLQPGQSVVSISSGGGGYGPPVERPPEMVRHDVIEGWVSRERAEEVYGVVFDENLAIDAEATNNRRLAIVARDRSAAVVTSNHESNHKLLRR
jgi:N-methylhydantoinase A